MDEKLTFGALCFTMFLVFGFATNDLIIVHCPKSVEFERDAGDIAMNAIVPVIAASFGIPFLKDIEWTGLLERNLFHRPKANALIVVTGMPAAVHVDITHQLQFHLSQVDMMDSTLNAAELVERMEHMNWIRQPSIVEFSTDNDVINVKAQIANHGTDDDVAFDELPTSLHELHNQVLSGTVKRWFNSNELLSLKMTKFADFSFVAELYIMQEIVNALVERNMTMVEMLSPDFYQFHINGLSQIVDTYGLESSQLTDAIRLLDITTQRISSVLRRLYNDEILIELVTLTSSSSTTAQLSRKRRDRNLLQYDTVENPLNLAPKYSSTYAASFHIIFWSMLGFALAVWFISYAIWYTDPGRDSIIYRMTSSRMKRD